MLDKPILEIDGERFATLDEFYDEVERVLIHEEAAPILTEVKRLSADLAALRKDLAARPAGG